MTAPEYFSVQDAAEHIAVHPALIRKEIRAGRLPAVKIGPKVIRIARRDLEAYLAAQRRGAN